MVDGQSIFIHRALVASVSKPLERLMSGGMCEAQNGMAVLKEVDEPTFTRFCQWVYSGYYSAGVHEDRSTDTAQSEQSRM